MRTRSFLLAGLFLTVTGTGQALAFDQDAAGSSDNQSLTQLSPDIVFKDKGVARAGPHLVVPAEATIHDGANQLRAAKATQKTDAMKRKECETAITDAKKKLEDDEVKYQHMNKYMGTIGDPIKQNQLIARINATVSDQKVQMDTLEDEKEKHKKLTANREAYIDLVMDLAEKADRDSHAYDELAKDQELAAAIDRNNTTPKAQKEKLGPTQEFLDDISLIQKSRDELSLEVLTVTMENNVPELNATLNGTLKTPMVWDSGATFVCISYAMADSLGLHPTSKDPVLKAKIADGRIIEGHEMIIKSVQVGIFTVNDVECMVMPEDIKDCPPLLGDSFQSHFAAKLDQASGQLRLTPLDAPAKKGMVTHMAPVPLAKPGSGN